MKLVLFVSALVAAAVLVWLLAGEPESTSSATATPNAALAKEPAQPEVELTAPATLDSTPGANEARVEIPLAPPPEPEAWAATLARLDVRVVSRETGHGASQHRIAALKGTAPKWEGRPGKGATAQPGESALSDAAGRATLYIEAGTDHTLRSLDAWGLEAGGALPVAPLPAGATAELELRVPTEPDLVFVGRVIAADTQLPLAGALVRVEREVEPSLESDKRGLLTVRARTWLEKKIRVAAPDYLPMDVELTAGHESEAAAFVVALGREASLVVNVFARPGEPAQGSVEVFLDDGAEKSEVGKSSPGRWSHNTSREGVARFARMPSHVPLRVRVTHGSRTKTLNETVVLSPGVETSVDVRLDLGARLRGVVVDSEGRGVPLAQLHLYRATHGARALISGSSNASVRANAQGEFLFEGLDVDRWAVGLEPTPTHDGGPRLVAAMGLVDVRSEIEEHEVRIVAAPGKQISGRVVDAQGRGVRAKVDAIGEGPLQLVSRSTNERGEFRIGPLPEGRFLIVAQGSGASSMHSARLEVDAGARELVLQLQSGGLVIVQFEGAPNPGRFELRANGMTVSSRSRAFTDNGQLLGPLPLGKNTIEAVDDGGRVLASAEVDVVEGPRLNSVRLDFPAGATDEQR